MNPSSQFRLPYKTSVACLQPLWKFFEEISSIPRASKHEAAVLAYVKRFADDRDLSWREDGYGNMVVERAGMNGGEGAATVVIQGKLRWTRNRRTFAQS